MFRRKSKPRWFVDPVRVAFGSIVGYRCRNLSHSHVRVKYRGVADAEFVPLANFFQRCRDAVREGRTLDIDHLLVAPIIKQRHAKFFDSLTDWGPAARRAYRAKLRPGE